MKQGIFSLLLITWSSISAPYAHTIDEFVSDDQLNTEVLTTKVVRTCKPRHIHPDDLDRYYDGPREERKNFSRYYASEALGIEKGEQPPYEAFKNPEAHLDDIKRLLKIVLSFSDDKDTCDKEGIKYIARLYHYFCPGEENFKALSREARATVEDLVEFQGPVFDLAREVANCPYITETIINKKKD